MEGLGEGYEAFVERLQSDFAAANTSKGSGENGNANPKSAAKLSRGAFPPHFPHQSKYVGYPSPANAFTLKAPSVSESSVRSGRAFMDMSREEAATSSGSGGTSNQVRNLSSDLHNVSDTPYRHRGHRRAQSEIAFRLPDDINFDYEPFPELSTLSDELGDNLLSMHIDMDKMKASYASMALPVTKTSGETNSLNVPSPHHARSLSVDRMLADFNSNEDAFGLTDDSFTDRTRPRHSHSNSMDGSSVFQNDILNSSIESVEGKKAAAANKLAELALIDPKRAKRILANRQSAARSKERKMRYIGELEHKVQALQTEATALSAQLTMMQKDTTVLTAENNELKFQLQSLERQAHLSSALNMALKEEVQRLKLATGEIMAGNGQLMKHGDQPVLSGKQFYKGQHITDPITAGQQLQQLQSALKNQPIGTHQNVLQPASLRSQQGLPSGVGGLVVKSDGLSIAGNSP